MEETNVTTNEHYMTGTAIDRLASAIDKLIAWSQEMTVIQNHRGRWTAQDILDNWNEFEKEYEISYGNSLKEELLWAVVERVLILEEELGTVKKTDYKAIFPQIEGLSPDEFKQSLIKCEESREKEFRSNRCKQLVKYAFVEEHQTEFDKFIEDNQLRDFYEMKDEEVQADVWCAFLDRQRSKKMKDQMISSKKKRV